MKIKLAVFLFPFLFLCFVVLVYFFFSSIYDELFGLFEQGLFEWVQFACYLISSIFGFKSFLALKRISLSIQSYILLSFSIGCIFIALEEVSYGQHILKWSTPEAISKLNLQNETNLHNLAAVQQSSVYNDVIGLICLYGAFSWLLRFYASPLSIFDLIFPPWFVSSYFFIVLWYWIQFTSYASAFINPLDYSYQEVFETILSFGFLSVGILNYSKTVSAPNFRIISLVRSS